MFLDPVQPRSVPPAEGWPTLPLSAEWQALTFHLPQPATPHLRLVFAHDCRRAVRVSVRGPGWTLAHDAQIMAAWESALLPLPPLPAGELRLAFRVEDRDAGLRESLVPDAPGPALLLPPAAWPELGTGLLVLGDLPDPRTRARRYLGTPGAWDYLGWMTGCTALALERVDLDALERRLRGPGEGLPLLGGALQREEAQAGAPDDPNTALEQGAPVAALVHLARARGWPPETAARWASALAAQCRPLPALTTEGCFTLAYPLAALANFLGDDRWADLAVRAVEDRWAALVRDGTVWQRAEVAGPGAWLQGWARGTAWLTLGTVLSALELPAHRARLLRPLPALFRRLLALQRPDGLWPVFIGRDTPPEASGSAGIAASMALAAGCPELDELEAGLRDELWAAARRARTGLDALIDAEGCLTKVSQHNPAREEALQLGWRIRAAWGTGLYVTLLEVLERGPAPPGPAGSARPEQSGG